VITNGDPDNPNIIYQEKGPAGSLCTAMSAEICAIERLLVWLEGNAGNPNKVLICCDCRSALTKITNPTLNRHLEAVNNCAEVLERLQTRLSVGFLWIKSHCGIPGNSLADKLAKEGCRCGQLGGKVTAEAFKRATRKGFVQAYTREDVSNYRKMTPRPTIHQEDRHSSTRAAQIISGICPLTRYFLNKIGVEPSHNCRRCDAAWETVDHVFHCPWSEEWRRDLNISPGDGRHDILLRYPVEATWRLEQHVSDPPPTQF